MNAHHPTRQPPEQEPKIKVSLQESGQRRLFVLSYQGESVRLDNTSSLNKWTAQGLTQRHELRLGPDGVTLDGRAFSYSDPRAPADLEHLLNQSSSVAPVRRPAPVRSNPAAWPPSVAEKAAHEPWAIEVIQEGFEFHLKYRTRFGQLKNERLEVALKELQEMGVFKPHVTLQKIGIRLAVTTWDGEKFAEEEGIENLERVTAEEIQRVISRYLEGQPENQALARQTSAASKRTIVSLELTKKAKDPWFCVIFHRQDGSQEEGPLLIRPNLGKLQEQGLFEPNVSVSMTALQEQLIIDRREIVEGKEVIRTESLPLKTEEDAARAAAALNRHLRQGAPPSTLLEARDRSAPALPQSPRPGPPEVELTPPLPETNAAPAVGPGVTTSSAKPAVEVSPLPAAPAAGSQQPPSQVPESYAPAWIAELLIAAERLPPEQVNKAAFDALSERLETAATLNDHGYPRLSLSALSDSGSLELVLMPRYLLCQVPAGYVRFGSQTRLFLGRMDDYIEFPSPALRGIAAHKQTAALLFLVSQTLIDHLKSANREYARHFGSLLQPAAHMPADTDLVWPYSREEELFRRLAALAKQYQLPATNSAIALDPNSASFLGFRRLEEHGIEFCNGDNYARFTPAKSELHIGTYGYKFPRSARVSAWALDAAGKMCAIYDRQTGFAPPPETGLLRFLSKEEKQAETGSLNVLAALDD